MTNDDQGDQGDVQPAEVVAAARDEGAGASPGQQPGGGVPAQAMDTGAGARPAASPLAAPVDPSTPAPSTTTTLQTGPASGSVSHAAPVAVLASSGCGGQGPVEQPGDVLPVQPVRDGHTLDGRVSRSVRLVQGNLL